MPKPASRAKKPSSPPPPQRSFAWLVSPWAAVVGLVALTLLAYVNSFQGAFVYDDIGHIVNGLSIRPLWPLTDVIRAGGPRWLLIWTLSLNHALGGLDPWGYHAFNLAVHLATGLLLWKIARDLLRRPLIGGALTQHANALAFAIALLWLVHPLQTQAVTYIVQRCEAMMALCFLALLWCLLESTQRAYRYVWLAGAIGCFWIGLGTKEVMATAPAVALAFDRIFLAKSWKEVLRQRGWVYGLMLLPLLLFIGKIRTHLIGSQASNVGFGLDSLTPWEYALSQAGVILHYLRLVIVPYPLCIDYEWPVTATWQQAIVPGGILLSLLLLTAWALYFRPRLGFLGFSFFVILAPTSSIVPIGDLAVEHRMYLPLAPVLVLLVLAAHALLVRVAERLNWSTAGRSSALKVALLVPALIFLLLTIARNRDYASSLRLWQSTVSVRPQNARANHNLCAYLVDEGQSEEALSVVQSSIARCEAGGWPTRRHYIVLGETLARMNRWEEARTALAVATADQTANGRETPAETRTLAEAYLSLATASAAAGETDLAEQGFQRSVAMRPDFAIGHALYGEFLARQDRNREAAAAWQEAARLQPTWFEMRRDLGLLLAKLNENEKALEQVTLAAQLRPHDADIAELREELMRRARVIAAP